MFRALGQGARHEHRGTAIRGRLVGGADRQDQDRADQRPPGQVDDEDRQAVVELVPRDGREGIGPRRAGRRSLGDDHTARALRGHAATSSFSVSAASGSTASLSALGVAGTYVSTSRLSCRNVAPTTSRIASGVTAR